jgi:hypothetical protein
MGDEDFLESLTDSSLYAIGAAFADSHPELVDEVLEQSAAIERDGLVRWAAGAGIGLEPAFETLVTGLALRYYRALTS